MSLVRRESDYRQRILFFILLSLALHTVIMLVIVRPMGRLEKVDQSKKTVFIELDPHQEVRQASKSKGQIVETTLAQKTDKAADQAFLGQQTQIVAEQTRAKTVSPFQESKVGGASKPEDQLSKQSTKKLPLANLGVPMDLKPLGNLGPQSPSQIASTNDYLKNIKTGAQTLLNTREYQFFGFYQRVRRQLERHWEPGLRQRLKKMFDQGRRLAEDREHSTRVMVVMNHEGMITKILVEDTSGFIELDSAAVDAFNRAGPFPNPPKGMLERDGTVKVEWEFVLKT